MLEETRYEKLPVTVYPDASFASKKVAARVANLIKAKNETGEIQFNGFV